MPKSDTLLGTNVPFVQAHHVGGKQRPTAISLRTSFTIGAAGAANGIAQAWFNPNNKIDSCHYVVDESRVIRCIPDNRQAKSLYFSGVYKNAITINVCYDPPDWPLDNVVYLTAKHTARLCRLYGIKPRVLDDDQKSKWLRHPWKSRGGIILDTVGDFPSDYLLYLVKYEYKGFEREDYHG